MTATEFPLSSLTPDHIEAMNYNQLIALVRETNRYPGGRRSVFDIAQRTLLTASSQVLEIGCATGSTAIELFRLTKSNITALDINATSITEARRRSKELGFDIDFRVASAKEIPLPDDSVDLLICGNVTTLIDEKRRALAEYRRVLREGGVLVAAPMYYIEQPPQELFNDVCAAIQVQLPLHFRQDALSLYSTIGLEQYDVYDYELFSAGGERIDNVVEQILSQQHLSELHPETKLKLDEKYRTYMHLFDRNMHYLGFSTLFLRKTRFPEDPELFLAKRLD